MVETVTETVPVPAGTTTVRLVELLTLTEVPAVEPKSTLVEPETNPVPVTVTVLAPAWGPLLGLTAVTVGAVPVDPLESWSRLALVGTPSVKNRLPLPVVEDRSRAAQRGQLVRGSTGDGVDVACGHGGPVGTRGPGGLGQHLDGRARPEPEPLWTARTTLPAESTVTWLVPATLDWTPAVPSDVAVVPPLPASL